MITSKTFKQRFSEGVYPHRRTHINSVREKSSQWTKCGSLRLTP